MFIKNLIYNYNAQELLLVASRLVFAFDAWLALILIMELNVVLFIVRKKKRNRRNLTILFWVFMITLPLAQPTIMIQFFIILSFSKELTIEHGPSYNFHLKVFLQHHFRPFPSKHDTL